MLERIKTILGFEDELQDGVLEIFIENVTKHLLVKLKRKDKTLEDVPDELNFIIEEITVRRFNRIGTEGMKSETVEGHRVDFYELEKEFTPYEDIIDDYGDDDSHTPKRGKAMFI